MFKFLHKKIRWNVLDEQRNWVEAEIPFWSALLDFIPLIGFVLFIWIVLSGGSSVG